MTNEDALGVNVRQFRVASDVLAKEYENVHRAGQFDDPRLATDALQEVDQMVTSLLLAGLDKVRYDGSHINRLLDMGREQENLNKEES